jgi:hypothetical protein
MPPTKKISKCGHGLVAQAFLAFSTQQLPASVSAQQHMHHVSRKVYSCCLRFTCCHVLITKGACMLVSGFPR